MSVLAFVLVGLCGVFAGSAVTSIFWRRRFDELREKFEQLVGRRR